MGRLRKPENHSRVETRLVIRPFTVKVDCQIRGLASIRKGLGKENTPFIVSSISIIASENVSGRVSGEIFESLSKAIFTNPEGSQSGRFPILPIRKGPNFANPEVSQFCQSEMVPILPIRRVPILQIRKGPNFANPKGPKFANTEGSQFCQSGRIPIFPIRKGPNSANPEGSQFWQSEGALFLPIRKDPIFANPEGSQFCQSGRVPILPIRQGPSSANPEGYYFCQPGGVLILLELK